MTEFDNKAINANEDNQKLSEFIEQSEWFILKCALKVTHHYITKADDEWSFALQGFVQAVQTYVIEKGSFYSYAELVISRKLIDFYKSQKKYKAEISVAPDVFNSDPEENDDNIALRVSVAKNIVHVEENILKDEIMVANKTFAEYGFSFYDLAECSPKAEKTKNACAVAVCCLLKNDDLLNELVNNKQLPIKKIEKIQKVHRKILERHRKYIIAATVILSGEYPGLAEYMRFIRKELNK